MYRRSISFNVSNVMFDVVLNFIDVTRSDILLQNNQRVYRGTIAAGRHYVLWVGLTRVLKL